ncbi:tyrosine-type recombinase/integrase [Parabacteroides johnsonii]|jgi:integrase|uniref:Core-binding (CB) domain-containing protein n=3 Tax=Parabacteroides johnsonii TaxID=387661 RepID=K5Z4R9_9BACT|nr:site-specific integrase [Parabacteroides johnsonii]CCX76390.1 putative uncharacterized protein [Parabacteroides johnsonii CAG:246]EEC97381.1 site-specific recombinase, phage integrase family [Parabacteroides johnsonii DSM 18315]EKN06321.1 hypothetical protein HMPREF1077_03344 [Parabacteroides johnsonii CL02T12C29]MBV4242358.1 site-specific integrase [Parabacteroides johnsonii]MBX9108400.1 site-specific integrase [Parabacteroides johnsonii]
MEKYYRLSKKERNGTRVFGDYINERAHDKRLLGKDSTADLYQAAGYHFRNFCGKEKCRLSDLNSTLIMDFTNYLQCLRLKTNTINSYLSSLRAIFNAALRSQLVKVKDHPFGELKLKREVTAKRAVSVDIIKQIAAVDLKKDRKLELAADLSLFGFMAYGMPFVDIVHLKKENISGDEIIYNRHKTGVQIRIKMTTGMQLLMEKYQNEGPYIFPVLTDGTDYQGYKLLLAGHNRSLKKIGELLNVPAKLTSYVMRHTWASEALRCNIPIAVISQAMGHTSEKTTRIYLAQLDVSVLNKANQVVTGGLETLLTGKQCHLFAK